MRWTATILVLGLMMSGPAFARSHHSPPTSAERGHQVARVSCASCHAVEARTDSPVVRAPAFASREMQHTAGLAGRMADLTRRGHYGMPPVALSPEQVADLLAYIESLSRRDDARRDVAGDRLARAN